MKKKVVKNKNIIKKLALCQIQICLFSESEIITGKSMSEALIFASTNPQYDNRLLVQYMKIPSSERGENIGRTWVEHVVHISCSECQNKNKKQFLYTTCSLHILNLQFS